MKKATMQAICLFLTFCLCFAIGVGALSLESPEVGAEAESDASHALLSESTYRSTLAIDRTVYFIGDAGDEFNITYTGAAYAKDWISLIPTRSMTTDTVTSGTTYHNYMYVAGVGDGVRNFPANRSWQDLTKNGLRATEYMAVMLANNGYTECSNRVYFRAIDRSAYDAAGMSLTADRAYYHPGDTVTLTYKNTGTKDWVGLYTPKMQIGVTGQESLAWAYAAGTGTSSLKIPASLTPGTYHLVLLQNDGYTQLYALEITVLAEGEEEPGLTFVPYEGVLDPQYGILLYSHDFEKEAESKDVTAYNDINTAYIDAVSGFSTNEGGTGQSLVTDPMNSSNHALQLYRSTAGNLIYHVNFSDTTDGYGRYTIVNRFLNKVSTIKNMYTSWLKIGGNSSFDANADLTETLNSRKNTWYTSVSRIYASSAGTAMLTGGKTYTIANGKVENFYLGANVTGEDALLLDDIRLYYLPENSVQFTDGSNSCLVSLNGSSFTLPAPSALNAAWPDNDGLIYYDAETKSIYQPGETVNRAALNGHILKLCAPDAVEPTAPASIAFTPAQDAPAGFADGVMTAVPGAFPTDGVVFYWGNDEGPLDDYTYVGYGAYDEGSGRYIYNVTGGNLIPEGVTQLYARGVNGSVYDLQNGTAELTEDICRCALDVTPLSLGEPLYSFEVISDLHTGTGRSHEANLLAALNDIAQNRPNTSGIMMAGDLVDHGDPAEYALLREYFDTYVKDIPLYMTVGNHEFYYNQIEGAATGDFFYENWERFREFAGWNEGEFYRYLVIGGDYFIFMGEEARGVTGEGSQGTADGYYSEEQREWLRTLLARAAETGANAFVFMHQSIENTVSGSFDGQNWNGINDDELMKAVIESYPNTYLFTGHSHWNLNSRSPFINGGLTGASYFNTASCGYLWNDANTASPGSEGLHVDVYDGYVVVRGRDFINQKWISNVQAAVEIGNRSITAPLTLPVNSIRTASPSGLRFAAYLGFAGRDIADEYGFLAALADESLGSSGEKLVFDGEYSASGVNSDGVRYVSGVSYRKDGDTDLVYSLSGAEFGENSCGEGIYFTAVLRNIPAGHEKTAFAVRPYLRVGKTVYYGEMRQMSLYETASQMMNTPDVWNALSAEDQSYISGIVAACGT